MNFTNPEEASTLEDRIRVQNGDKLEKWSELNEMKFSKDKFKMFPLGTSNAQIQIGQYVVREQYDRKRSEG